MKRLLFVLPVVLFAGVVLAFAIGLNRDPAKLPSVLIGKPLPVFSLPPWARVPTDYPRNSFAANRDC